MPLPEGPEIRRAADELAAAIAGQRVTKVFFAFDHLKPYASRLQGETVCQVKARGKAILTRFSNGLTLYTHNQLWDAGSSALTANIRTARVSYGLTFIPTTTPPCYPE